MLFNSIAFLVFFPIVCILYFLIPSSHLRIRNLFLLVASYCFYMNWEPVYALLILTSTIITYLGAIGIDHFSSKTKRKTFLVIGITLNLIILFLFKYYNFAASNIDVFLHASGLGIDVPKFKFLLPVGISFYTFQALGYLIDVYQGETQVERDFFSYALFVSFFPQLVAGPIERSNNLLPQFKEKHQFDYDRIMDGLRMMLWGYFLKLALAERCGIYVDYVFDNLSGHNGGSMLLASLLFPFQIYGDFAGYSLIAIGTAKVLGFRLMENFHRPYFSTSVSEFWHRWHISLSTWLRDYVYFPLGGSRVGIIRSYFNLFITFVVSGIWHGANWTFLCWGIMHGTYLCIERALKINKREFRGINKSFHWIITFILVSAAWIIFRAKNMSDVFTILSGIVSDFALPQGDYSNLLACAVAMIILAYKSISDEFNFGLSPADAKSWLVRHIYFILMILYILLFGVLDGSQFIYFQF